jgi:hypothetical protein
MGLIFIYILFFAVALVWILRNRKLNYYRKIGVTALAGAAFFFKSFSIMWCLLLGISLILAVIAWREEKRLETLHRGLLS